MDTIFDPQLISVPDVGVEAVADIDVPELVHDEPQPVEPDYDTDIEREFAEIVDSSDADSGAAVSASFASTEAWGRTEAAPRGYETSDDYIALERELGVEPSGHSYEGSKAHPDELAYADGDLAYVGDDGAEAAEDPAQRERGSRGAVLAFAVLGIAVLAGAGALGWSMLSGDDRVADGGPRIIRADTEPVKVLPENPGGKTVPNQDKAVYDRVAGGDASSPGQPSLVNTAEEPVDVVQRTLDPEVLPLEGRGDVTEKSEERLAADSEAADGVSDAASAPVVSPRRVRTMIVKPDGSIVAREELEPEPEAAVAQPTPALTEPGAAEAITAQPEGAEVAELAEPASDPAPLEQAAAEPAPGAGLETPALAPRFDRHAGCGAVDCAGPRCHHPADPRAGSAEPSGRPAGDRGRHRDPGRRGRQSAKPAGHARAAGPADGGGFCPCCCGTRGSGRGRAGRQSRRLLCADRLAAERRGRPGLLANLVEPLRFGHRRSRGWISSARTFQARACSTGSGSRPATAMRPILSASATRRPVEAASCPARRIAAAGPVLLRPRPRVRPACVSGRHANAACQSWINRLPSVNERIKSSYFRVCRASSHG